MRWDGLQAGISPRAIALAARPRMPTTLRVSTSPVRRRLSPTRIGCVWSVASASKARDHTCSDCGGCARRILRHHERRPDLGRRKVPSQQCVPRWRGWCSHHLQRQRDAQFRQDGVQVHRWFHWTEQRRVRGLSCEQRVSWRRRPAADVPAQFRPGFASGDQLRVQGRLLPRRNRLLAVPRRSVLRGRHCCARPVPGELELARGWPQVCLPAGILWR